MRKQITTLAHQLRKAGHSWATAMKRAWAAIRAKLALANTDERGTWLTFRKVDGTIRNVLATRNLTHIPAQQHPKNGDSQAGVTIRYYDIWEGGWKCFRADSLLKIG